MSLIQFFFNEVSFKLGERRRLKVFIEKIFHDYKKDLESLNFIFCTDEYLLSINRDFLDHDYYTDIITFNLSAGSFISGEVYISIDRVRDNAVTAGTTFHNEIHRVIFHGVLHLCGFNDKSKKDKQGMTAQENHCLKKYL